jgi:hypothetical protein
LKGDWCRRLERAVSRLEPLLKIGAEKGLGTTELIVILDRPMTLVTRELPP